MYYLEKLSALISKYMAVLVIAIAAIALIESISMLGIDTGVSFRSSKEA